LPVGNDVVDLGHPLCQPHSIHPRFDSRAFSTAEIAYLAAAADVHRTRWSLWAAKESAFKAARQLAPQVRFIPRDFAVRLSGERAEVTHRLGRFDIWFDQADEWLHAVASRNGEKPGLRVSGPSSGNEEIVGADPSERVRKLARAALAAQLNIAPGEIRIATVEGIPRVQRRVTPRRGPPERGESLPIDLSLSHDGRFVACAWSPLEAPQEFLGSFDSEPGPASEVQ